MAIKRTVVTDKNTGYKSVSLSFRKQRAKALDTAQVHKRGNRIHCPVLDASRTSGAYGSLIMPTCDDQGITKFSTGLNLPTGEVKAIAYLSGPWYKTPSNIWYSQFDDQEVNVGLVKTIKNNVNSGIIASGAFDQDAFNRFVWVCFPALKDKRIDNEFLESSEADDLYITPQKLDQIVEFNQSRSDAFLKGLGAKMSRGEMEKLLLGRLGQEIPIAESSKETVKAVSLRDFHDLYKYGVFPAPHEDGLLEAGLIEDWSLAMSAETSTAKACLVDNVPAAG